ncbi:REP-associated tyrosine transposase [Hymenobacter chitinivorans]|uniref:Transposase IS200 family protein n=1 Tax=Hymenobacter chitinivorans DSM 11115 TaxID=1121954 RepID=A0A2M9BMB0_9BACT|nr:transposase [Hymenobacter chitinivorans]PJJ59078.1 transposase IS200 family protein [Hymenobacter chitinivorans DSM 11115]
MGDLIHYERNLPHRLPPGSDIFLTFRLADSLPGNIILRLQLQFSSGEETEDNYAKQRRYFGKFDNLLDGATHGPIWLQEPRIADLVGASLRHFHGKAYQLICYCIMPNHVHLVVSFPDEAPPLAKTIQRIKGYTALQANQLLNRRGQFWQRETYDHIIRSSEEMQRVIAYTINNPVKAGLVDNWEQWPYTYWAETQ